MGNFGAEATGEQKGISVELRESEERFRTLIHCALDAIIGIDQEGFLTEWNQQAEKIFGWTASEVLRKKLSETIIPPSLRKAHELGFARYLKTGENQTSGKRMETEAIHKDGTQFPIELSIMCVRVKGRYSFFGFIRDLSCIKSDQARFRDLFFRNQLILESAGEGIFGLDNQGQLEFVNPAAASFLGYTAEELLRQPIHQTIHHHKANNEPYSLEACPINATLQQGESRTVLNEVFWRKNGSSFPVQYTSTPMKDAKGKIVGAVVVFSDLTEREKLEKEKKENELFMRMESDIAQTLIQKKTLPDILQQCAETINSHLNGAFCRIWIHNQTREVLELQASAGMYTHKDGSHGEIAIGQYKIGFIAQECQPCLTNQVLGDPRIHDQEWAKREGMVSFAGYPLLVGCKLVGVLGIFARHTFSPLILTALKHVCQRIAMGIDRIWAMKEIEASHWENEKILTTLTGILIGVNAQDEVTRWNDAAEAAFELSRMEALGKNLTDLRLSWDWIIVAQGIWEARNQAKIIRLPSITLNNQKGRIRKLDLTIAPILHKNNLSSREEDGFLILGTDITERDILETQLVLAQKMESIGQLAAGIAHEINTPIQYISDNLRFLQESFTALDGLFTAFQALTTLARDGSPPEPTLQNLVSTVQSADLPYLAHEIPQALRQSLEGAERVAKIVRAMKEFSHPGSEEKKPIDVNQALETTITVARNEWKYLAEIERHLDPALPLVPALPGELNQVFLNLLVNAAQAIGEVIQPGGEEKGRITVSTRQQDIWAEIRIQDTGPGIPEAMRQRIFEPFFTTKEVGKGTGQGLAIAHNVVVNKHGGQLFVESELGRSTTFCILLPIHESRKGSVSNGKDHCETPNSFR